MQARGWILGLVSLLMPLPSMAVDLVPSGGPAPEYETIGTLTVWAAWECEPQDPIALAEVWFRFEDDTVFGPFYTGSDGSLTVDVYNGVGDWDIAVATCDPLEAPCVKYDIYVGDHDDVDAGKCIGCFCSLPYEPYNGPDW